jgi:two-component system OmpR family response regulator
MRILLAEDDRIIADGLSRSLRQGGYAIDCAYNGIDADTALMTNNYDLLILDLGLPRLPGLDVLRRLRARKSGTPVLILTALDGIEDRVKGLDLGADDYMAKPFELVELEARVRALSRRSSGTPHIIECGSLTFDQTDRCALVNGEMLDLSARELGLLEDSPVAREASGQQGPAGRSPLRLGGGGQPQCDRGLCPPPCGRSSNRPA